MKLLVKRDITLCPACKRTNALNLYIGDEIVNQGDRADCIKCKYCGMEFGIIMTDKDRLQRPLIDGGKSLQEFIKLFTG